ncbi:Gfo/Idh/MocA family protein [Tardisphaera saccharovorans]|nr:Gfo/Idh/MocA family oxidoreductase [TACK group archaeon]
MTRVGIIGVGGHGVGRHLVPYKKLEEVEVVAVADLNEERAKQVSQKYGVPNYYRDYREMLEREDLDAVSVVTPSGLHAEIAKVVAQYGVNLLVDKPLAPNLDAAVDAAVTARDHNAVLMVGYWSRFSPWLQHAISLREKGFFGKFFFSYASILRRRGIPGSPTFIDEKLSGGKGALFDIGCYSLDSMLSILGFPKPVRVTGHAYTVFGNKEEETKMNWGTWDHKNFRLDDYSAGFITFEDGSSAIIEASWASNLPIKGEVSNLRVQGDMGGVQGAGDESLKSLIASSKSEGKVYDEEVKLQPVDEAFEMIKAFVQSLSSKQPPVTAQQSLVLHAIIDAVYKSSELKKEVEVEVPPI